MKTWKIFPYFLFFVFLVGIALALTYNFLDPDFGWHVKSGELILQRGIPYQDWYTYTMPTFAWINHEWLMDIGMYKALQVVGFRGVQLLFLLVFTAGFFVIKKKRWPLWAWALPVFLAYMATIEFLGVRPQLFTALFVAILIALVEKFLEVNSKVIWWVPLLFLAWVNLHASFFGGLFILCVILACELFKKTPLKNFWILKNFNYQEKPWRPIGVLAGVTAISLLVTFINPYGIRIYEELFRTIGDGYLKFHIAEWFPLVFTGFKPLISLYIGVVVGCGLVFYRRLAFNHLVLSAVFLLLSLSSIRYFLLFAIVAIPLLVESALQFYQIINRQKLKIVFASAPLWYKVVCFIPVIILLASFGMYGYQLVNERMHNSGIDYYPEKALSFVANLPDSERIFNEYGWGGYIIWNLPNRKVFIDGRMPSWRLPAQAGQDGQFVFKDYIDITDANPGFEKILEKYGVTVAFIPHNKLAGELTNLGWNTIYEDESAIVLKKP